MYKSSVFLKSSQITGSEIKKLHQIQMK